jgi:hypothetical protein
MNKELTLKLLTVSALFIITAANTSLITASQYSKICDIASLRASSERISFDSQFQRNCTCTISAQSLYLLPSVLSLSLIGLGRILSSGMNEATPVLWLRM